MEWSSTHSGLVKIIWIQKLQKHQKKNFRLLRLCLRLTKLGYFSVYRYASLTIGRFFTTYTKKLNYTFKFKLNITCKWIFHFYLFIILIHLNFRYFFIYIFYDVVAHFISFFIIAIMLHLLLALFKLALIFF